MQLINTLQIEANTAIFGIKNPDLVIIAYLTQLPSKDDLKVKMKLFQKSGKKHFCKSLLRREWCIIIT